MSEYTMSEYKINDYTAAAQQLQQADAILVTASNGLSIAEGYHIFADNEDYRKYFGKFRDRYGTDCLIRGVFTPMTPADHREYMQIVHQYLIEDYQGSKVMKDLLRLIQDKPYFVVTSNADTHFQMNGFDPDRIFEVEGNFDGLKEQSAAWNAQQERFSSFLRTYATGQLVLFELGIGSRNGLIKAPTMKMAVQHPSWHYITMNMPREINVPAELASRTIALEGDIANGFETMLG